MESGEDSTMRNFIVCTLVKVIKSRRLRRGGQVDRMEEGRSSFKFLTGKPTRKRPLRGLGVDGRAILEWPLKK